VVVSDGALVLETVRQVHADLLILDIMMPGLSGIEVYDRVREDSSIRDMPVLFVSANTPMFDSEFRKRNLTSVSPSRSTSTISSSAYASSAPRDRPPRRQRGGCGTIRDPRSHRHADSGHGR
jgi:CheY-like chemotaxis protein